MNQLFRKTFLLLTAFLGTGVFLTCRKSNDNGPVDSCNGTSPKPSYYKIEALNTELKDKSGKKLFNPSFVSSDSLILSVYASDIKHLSVSGPRFSFFQEAFACSPMVTSVNPIVSIKLISRNDLAYQNNQDSIKTGEDISERFIIMERGDSLTPAEYFGKSFAASEVYLRFKAKPFQPVTVNAELQIKLKDSTLHILKNRMLNVR